MKNTAKTLSILMLVFTTVSCHWDINIGKTNGDGNVMTETRKHVTEFTQLKASEGLQVILTHGTEQGVVVKADQNLLPLIKTYVSNGELRINVDGNIGSAASKKVLVTYTSLNKIRTSSGADVIVNNTLKEEYLTLDASSGSAIDATIFSKKTYLEASSGANINISGKTKTLGAKASSGAEIKAKELLSAFCNARASSGGHITVNVQDNLEAKSSSGGQIDYYGNPIITRKKDKDDNDVRKMN